MTKQEALIELSKGNKFTHKYFSDNEFMWQNGDTYVFEDGYGCHPMLFWKDRQSDEWENNWEIFKTK